VPEPGKTPTPASIVETCAGRLAPVKHPREVAFVPRMPLGASGKVLKRELRRLIATGELVTTKVS
jgi:acyl-coenzyme A synthetase/AMP-(fatty) acid ligase